MRLEPGMLAKSKAGHDKNCIYVIICVNDEYVYLADGLEKSIFHAKKKNKKHIQPITKIKCNSLSEDQEIRNIIDKYSKSIESRNEKR